MSRPDGAGQPDDAGPVSDAEREALVAALQRHVAEGRIDLAAFDTRAGQVYAAATRAQARAAIADLPPIPPPATRRRRRGHGEVDVVAPHWVATDEVFRDPASGVVMRVWVDPTDGSRHYVPA